MLRRKAAGGQRTEIVEVLALHSGAPNETSNWPKRTVVLSQQMQQQVVEIAEVASPQR